MSSAEYLFETFMFPIMLAMILPGLLSCCVVHTSFTSGLNSGYVDRKREEQEMRTINRTAAVMLGFALFYGYFDAKGKGLL